MDDSDTPRDRSDRDLVSRLAEDPSTVGALIGDLYRGEVTRAAEWRVRLDQTTNWAVILVAAILTWAFSSRSNPHYVILIGIFGVTAFLLIEARRFQEYDIRRTRVSSLQEHVFVRLLTHRPATTSNWHTQFGEQLLNPSATVPFSKAVGHRLRRMYLALLLILTAAWITRITVFHPREEWLQSASIPGIRGEIVALLVLLYLLVVAGITLWTTYGAKAERS